MDSADVPAAAILAGPLTDSELPADITNEVPALTRIELYGSCPCLFVTTRILVVDMLSRRVQGRHISGIIVMNAHRWACAVLAAELAVKGKRSGSGLCCAW